MAEPWEEIGTPSQQFSPETLAGPERGPSVSEMIKGLWNTWQQSRGFPQAPQLPQQGIKETTLPPPPGAFPPGKYPWQTMTQNQGTPLKTTTSREMRNPQGGTSTITEVQKHPLPEDQPQMPQQPPMSFQNFLTPPPQAGVAPQRLPWSPIVSQERYDPAMAVEAEIKKAYPTFKELVEEARQQDNRSRFMRIAQAIATNNPWIGDQLYSQYATQEGQRRAAIGNANMKLIEFKYGRDKERRANDLTILSEATKGNEKLLNDPAWRKDYARTMGVPEDKIQGYIDSAKQPDGTYKFVLSDSEVWRDKVVDMKKTLREVIPGRSEDFYTLAALDPKNPHVMTMMTDETKYLEFQASQEKDPKKKEALYRDANRIKMILEDKTHAQYDQIMGELRQQEEMINKSNLKPNDKKRELEKIRQARAAKWRERFYPTKSADEAWKQTDHFMKLQTFYDRIAKEREALEEKRASREDPTGVIMRAAYPEATGKTPSEQESIHRSRVQSFTGITEKMADNAIVGKPLNYGIEKEVQTSDVELRRFVAETTRRLSLRVRQELGALTPLEAREIARIIGSADDATIIATIKEMRRMITERTKGAPKPKKVSP